MVSTGSWPSPPWSCWRPPASGTRAPPVVRIRTRLPEFEPRPPPVVRAREDRAAVDDLDGGVVPELGGVVGRRELDADLARLAGVVRRHRLHIRERRAGPVLDQPARLGGGPVAAAEPSQRR